MQCATHPDVETELGCSRCGKAICPRCMMHTPVGARCRECANVRRVPTYNVSGGTLARGIGAAIFTGVAVGVAWWLVTYIAFGFFLFGLMIGLGAGYAVSEAVGAVTNRRAGTPLQTAAAGGVVLAFLVRSAMLVAIDGWALVQFRTDLSGLIALGIGVVFAVNRMR